MLSGLPDVVLTHVQRLERVERAQRRVTPEAPEASARGHAGGRDKRDRERERKGEARGSGRTKRKNFAYLFFFSSDTMFHLPRDDVAASAGQKSQRRPRKTERERVGDDLNRRDTRRDGLLAEEFSEINAFTR